MQKEYKTVLHDAVAEFEEKKSKFIAAVKPVEDEEAAIEFINSIKTKHWDATHNVYAYSIVGSSAIQRFSDDGEPSGTAGMPVLEVIKRMGLQNVVVVVTRYFGGTLLGAAGLIRAYGRSAAQGLEAAGIIRKLLCVEFRVVMEYTIFGKLQSLIIAKGYTIKEVLYSEDVDIIVFVPVDEAAGFEIVMTDASNARAIVEQGEKTYITLELEGKIIPG